jgi:mRNA-degrading endonuclease RelE of RelBE toxin-antitoxin system
MIFFSKAFVKEVKRLSKKNKNLKIDILNLAEKIEQGKIFGSVVNGFLNHTVVKIRLQNTSNNKGKSSGYRIIYCIKSEEDIYFLYIYSKSELSNIKPNNIKKLIQEMK